MLLRLINPVPNDNLQFTCIEQFYDGLSTECVGVGGVRECNPALSY